MDLIDKANREEIDEDIQKILENVDDDVKLALCRDLLVERIAEQIKKCPPATQKELLAMLTHKLMNEWAI